MPAKGEKMKTKSVVFAGVSLAIAFALSYVKLFRFPWGGSVTLCSMLFVSIIGWFFGPAVGMYSALIYGIIQFFQGGSYVLNPLQVCLDYFAAFSALGVSGFFKDKKNGLLIGYLIGIALRGALHAIGGYLYWMDYMPEEFPKSLTAVYPIIYNYAYILGEGIITVFVISVPAVKKALERVRQMATS